MKKDNLRIDLNLDAGESQTALLDGTEESLYSLVSSINVACGGHAGDSETMKRSIELGLKHNVKIGAHPSFPDRQNFGRKYLEMSSESLIETLSEQVNSLLDVCIKLGSPLVHLKPHGALYNSAAVNPDLAVCLIKVAKKFNLILVGMAGSALTLKAKDSGVSFISEAFADRVYETATSLRSRTLPQSVIESEIEAAKQANDIIFQKRVRCYDGRLVQVTADTICIHGDNPNASAIAKTVYAAAKIN